MLATIDDAGPADWVYFKLYMGAAVDRIDHLILDLGEQIGRRTDIRQWFYIRYVDELGIHLRLRMLPVAGQREPVRVEMMNYCAVRLNRLHELPPGSYFPMVAAPGFQDHVEKLVDAHNDVRVIEAEYEPEYDKFGGPAGMPVAEAFFHLSSEIAVATLKAEITGGFSRKSLIPGLLREAYAAFTPQTDAPTFWREYAYYWLGGKSPAADDWRLTFREKARKLQTDGVPILVEPDETGGTEARLMMRWRKALAEAADAYATRRERVDVSIEVLCFNFAHLMSNRLGIAALEEAYMATLIEQLDQPARETAA